MIVESHFQVGFVVHQPKALVIVDLRLNLLKLPYATNNVAAEIIYIYKSKTKTELEHFSPEHARK